MPKIKLKPNSAEYADENKPTISVHCEMPGCRDEGTHRAPKDRSLDGYYTFCFLHVQEYNRAWDFFNGMSPGDIEDHIVRSGLWDRPTQKQSKYYEDLEEGLRHKAWQSYHFTEEKPRNDHVGAGYRAIDKNTPEYEAMAIMGLEPPLDLNLIKSRYKQLAKKYHPDINKDDPKAEELLKSINMAYTILKLSFTKYQDVVKND